MITFEGQTYDERLLSPEGKYYFERDVEIRRAAEKVSVIFVDAKVTLEALGALLNRNTANLLAEMAKLEPMAAPEEEQIEVVI